MTLSFQFFGLLTKTTSNVSLREYNIRVSAQFQLYKLKRTSAGVSRPDHIRSKAVYYSTQFYVRCFSDSNWKLKFEPWADDYSHRIYFT